MVVCVTDRGVLAQDRQPSHATRVFDVNRRECGGRGNERRGGGGSKVRTSSSRSR